MVIESRACPGVIQTGSLSLRPADSNSTMSLFESDCSSASAGLISAALSHTSLVTGLGSSCNQPLLPKRPSQMVGSGRKVISSGRGESDCAFCTLSTTPPRIPSSELSRDDERFSLSPVESAGVRAKARNETFRSGSALSVINPSCSARRQTFSKSDQMFCARQ